MTGVQTCALPIHLLLVDIYNRAKKLHIETEVRRVVFLVETNREKDGNVATRIFPSTSITHKSVRVIAFSPSIVF